MIKNGICHIDLLFLIKQYLFCSINLGKILIPYYHYNAVFIQRY